MKYYCIRQHDQRDCGAACVASIARNYGINKSLAYYRQRTKTDINGTNILGLIEALSEIGVISDAYEATVNDIIEADDKMFPMIARIINEDGQYHFIVINKKTDRKFNVSDPAKGRYTIKIDKFKEIFTGYIITVKNVKECKIQKEKSKTKQLFKELLKANKLIIFSIILTSIIITIAGVVTSLLIRYEFQTLENKEQIEYENITTNLDELYEIHEAGKLTEDEYLYYYTITENVNWIKENFYIIVLFFCGAIVIQSLFGYIKQKLYISIITRFENKIV